MKRSTTPNIPLRDSMKNIMEKLNTNAYWDLNFYDIITEETDKFLKGQLTKEKTAQNIGDRLWLFFNEGQ